MCARYGHLHSYYVSKKKLMEKKNGALNAVVLALYFGVRVPSIQELMDTSFAVSNQCCTVQHTLF